MPTSCCVRNCRNRRMPGDSSIYFHKFPNEESMKENWLVAIGRPELTIDDLKNKTVCSFHFPKNMYLDRPGTYKPRLKPDAVPTIFNFTEPTPVRRGRRRKRDPLAVALKRWGQKRNLEDPPYHPTKVIKRERASPPPKENDVVPQLSNPPPRRSSRPRKILIKREPGESPEPVIKPVVKNHVHPRKQKVKRSFKSMTELLQNLKLSRLITSDTYHILLHHFSNIPLNIFQTSINSRVNAYEEKVKEFALSLYYQSPKAYRFVRKRLRLPHPNTVKNWSFSCNYEPGLLLEVFKSLQSALQEKPWMSDSVLLIDFMLLSKQCVWSDEKERFLGYVNYGACFIEDEELLASEALVFYLVGLNGNWQCPIAYFLVNRINYTVLSQLIRTCLDKIADIGYRTWSVTFDGPLKNSHVIKMLGCNLITTEDNKHKISSSFKHPSRDYSISVLFDCCCMHRLARNVLCELKSFQYEKGLIEWKYFSKLSDLIDRGAESDTEVVLDSNKWDTYKLNVKLASQIFSSQVADAIDWLRDTANHPKFKNSQFTTEFIRIMESIFSVLDTRIYQDVKSQTVHKNNLEDKTWCHTVIHKFIGYLVKLQSNDGKMFLQHKNSQFIIGLIVTGNSLTTMATNYLSKSKDSGYLQNHKLSLRSLHLFFTFVRGNTTSNPNVLQLKRKLMTYFFYSNCLAFENFDSISKIPCLKQRVPLRDNYTFISRFEERMTEEMVFFLQNPFSQFKSNVLYYIAGFISKSLLGKLGCHVCADLLVTSTVPITSLDDHGYALYKPYVSYNQEVDLGGLIMASDDTITLVRLTEKYFHSLVSKSTFKVIFKQRMKSQITSAVMTTFVNETSIPFGSHSTLYYDLSEPPHHLQLIKKVIEHYLTLRLQIYW